MLKKIIIFATLFVLIKSYCEPESDELRTLGKIRDYEDCESRTSTDELEDGGYYKCCHLYYIEDLNNVYSEVDTCLLITKSQYDNIKRFIEDYEGKYRLEKAKIHCASSNVQFSLIFILLILFSLL